MVPIKKKLLHLQQLFQIVKYFFETVDGKKWLW